MQGRSLDFDLRRGEFVFLVTALVEVVGDLRRKLILLNREERFRGNSNPAAIRTMPRLWQTVIQGEGVTQLMIS
jgi:hypothetical protein